MRFKFILIYLFIFNSCSYPDIDSVPKFRSLNITLQESVELCKISNSLKTHNKEDCFKKLKSISDRL